MSQYKVFFLLCASVLLLGWRTQKISPPPPEAFPKCPVATSATQFEDVSYEGPYFSFKRTWKQGKWELLYRFKGLNDNWHSVTCRVDAASYQAVEDSYGYIPTEKLPALAVRLRDILDKEGREAKVLYFGYPVVAIVYDNGSGKRLFQVSWTEDPKAILIEEDRIKGAEEGRQFIDWFNKNKKALIYRAEESFLEQRGFLLDPKLGEIPDYSTLAAKSTPAIKNCIDELNRETDGNPEILGKFFQSMNYSRVDPVDNQTKKYIGGLLLPPAVMVRAEGDCDSKAAAFCAIQRAYPERLVIFRTFGKVDSNKQGHVLVGVEPWGDRGRSHQRQKWSGEKAPWPRQQLVAGVFKKPIHIGLRYFLPCEVSGPGRTPFGEVLRSGWYIVMPIKPLDKYIETDRR